MIPLHPRTTALIGAVGLWLTSADDPNQVSAAVSVPQIRAIAVDGSVKRSSVERLALEDVLLHEQVAGRSGSETRSPLGSASTVDVEALERRLQLNALRQRVLEASLPRTFILVNIPQARLWMVRDGAVEGSMRVVVGRSDRPTPEMATELTHLVLNPRWNVPQDLVRTTLAPEAVRTRGDNLSKAGFEVMSSWRNDADRVAPDHVDWKAVEAGRAEVAVRQKPGPGNAMGSAKFVITNRLGIYLHDSPDRALFQQRSRSASAGCIRLEDYRRLVDFVLPEPVRPGPDPDRPTYVRLGDPMPIYLTYVTALATDEGPRLFADPYHLDS